MKAIVKVAIGTAAAAACGVALVALVNNDKRVKASMLRAQARALGLAADADDIAAETLKASKAKYRQIKNELKNAKSDFDKLFADSPEDLESLFDFKKGK